MARWAHRRVLTAAEAKARRPLKAAQRLGPVGWVFAALAALWGLVALWPITQFSAFDSLSDDALLVLRTLGDVATVALPAGLLLGFPGVRRRNPWLFRGVVLIALVHLLQPANRALQGWVLEQVDLSAGGFNPLYAAMTLVSLAIGVVYLAGVLALSDGLFDAGARPRRRVLVLIGGAAVALEVVLIAPVIAANGLSVFPNGLLDVASLLISFGISVAWYVVVARLVVGYTDGLVPRQAWALGAVAGALFLVVGLGSTLLLWAGQLWGASIGLGLLPSVALSAVWTLLFLACALGLGRGTDRAPGDRRRLPRYELSERSRPAEEAQAG
jgi:hypothetical protein